MTRAVVLDALLAHLRRELGALLAVARMAMDEATSEESKAENKYDTRSLEASYLARGQAERVAALRSVVSWLETAPRAGGAVVGLGSVVEVEDDRGTSWFVLAPGAGGTRVPVGDVEVVVVTPGSPVGAALLGRAEDDEVVLVSGRELAVVTVV